MKYRAEIDGLRALAILPVILFHAGFEWFSGGFVGVDVFFVISGYLITTIIISEMDEGSFSLIDFYERRARRILPALFFVMLICVPFAWLWFIPSDLKDFGKSLIAVSIFSSNILFWLENDYFGTAAELTPLLHTWSLAVEEQFYILFPIVLLITFKYFKDYLIHILILGFLISLGLADWTSRNNNSISFYFIHTRMWELLAGSILAYYEITAGHRSKNKILNLILPCIGFFLIGYSILFFNENMLHPSLYTLSPIIGVCLIIWFSNKNEFITKILSTKLFVGIGLISYSLYLWHYPIFAFLRIYDFWNGFILIKSIFIIILFILSFFTYYFIEKYFRNKNNNFKFLLKLITFFLLLIVSINLIFNYNEGFKNRLHIPNIIKQSLKNLNLSDIKQNKKFCHNRIGYKGFCIFNELPNNKGDIIILGDSLSNSLLKDLIIRIEKTKFRLIHMSYSGMIYLPDFVSHNKLNNDLRIDERWHSTRKNFIDNKTHKNLYIIYYGDYNYYLREKRLTLNSNKIDTYETDFVFAETRNLKKDFLYRKKLLKEKLVQTLNILSKKSNLILLYPSPISPLNVYDRIHRNFNKKLLDNNFYLKDKINYDIELFYKYNLEIFDLFDNNLSRNIHMIKPHEVFCNKKCLFYDNNHVYFFDEVHPSLKGAEMINDLIMKKIEKIELQSN